MELMLIHGHPSYIDPGYVFGSHLVPVPHTSSVWIFFKLQYVHCSIYLVARCFKLLHIAFSFWWTHIGLTTSYMHCLETSRILDWWLDCQTYACWNDQLDDLGIWLILMAMVLILLFDTLWARWYPNSDDCASPSGIRFSVWRRIFPCRTPSMYRTWEPDLLKIHNGSELIEWKE